MTAMKTGASRWSGRMAAAIAVLAALAATSAAAIVPPSIPATADAIVVLADGTLLFDDNYGGSLVRLDPASGEVTTTDPPFALIRNPTRGADGRLWFTADSARQMVRYALPTGQMDVWPWPDNISGRIGQMALGLDGSLWATATDANRILRTLPTGEMRTYDLPSYDPGPIGIVQGPDGNMWFAEMRAKKIGRITTSGAVTEFAVQYPMTTGPSQITRGADGALWFASSDGFGRVAVNGEMQLFVTGPQSPSGRLVQSADGAFWLATGDAYVTRFVPPDRVERILVYDATAASAGLAIDGTGALYVVDRVPHGGSRLAVIEGAAGSPGDASIVEFYNALLGHYFMTANADEAAGIDTGAAGPGWSRTGETWPAWLTARPGASEVCRFYGNPAIDPVTAKPRGPNSHFYTFVGPECEQVRKDPGWLYEAGNRFFLAMPAAGACPEGLGPVYRAYNNGFATNDSNHRYAVKQSIYSLMVASGWKGEGVAMCAPLRLR
jgi:streptogramin lyase